MSNGRLRGITASAIGSILQVMLIGATLPPRLECGVNALCHFGGNDWVINIAVRWQPHVDNPADEGASLSEESFCPAQLSGPGPVVVAAPLPEGFDPRSYGGRDVFACVRLNSDGTVRNTHILSGTGRPSLDRALVQSISRGWRFSSAGQGEGWHRVRLSSGTAFPY